MIALFDSGVGGLSVFKELYRILPREDYLYYSDNANCPYGEKPVQFIRERAFEISRMLMGKGAHIIVVACNTATAAAIHALRERFDIPFIGMEPAIKPAALQSKSKVVGVLATAGTFKGELYRQTSTKYASGVTVIERVGKGLVELVEKGLTDYSHSSEAVMECIRPMLDKGADYIVLGCTHYPFLEDTIRKCAQGVGIINPAEAVAKHTADILQDKGYVFGNGGSLELLSSGDGTILEKMARSLPLENGFTIVRASTESSR